MEEALREAGTQGGWVVLHLQGNFQASATAPSVLAHTTHQQGPQRVATTPPAHTGSCLLPVG